jgi:fatty acid desaturase
MVAAKVTYLASAVLQLTHVLPHVSPAMTVAARVKPEAFFSPDEWLLLSARSKWRGLAVVAHCWLTITLAIGTGIVWPWLIPLAIVVVGNRQLGLFILMHDAAHGALHANRAVNDWVGKWLCGVELAAYRSYHLQHHRFVQQSEDPDLVLSAPFPVTQASLKRKIIRDLTGQTFYKQQFGSLAKALKTRPADTSAIAILANEIKRRPYFYGFNVAGFLMFLAAGYGWAWLVLWLLPMATWLPVVTRLRNIAEHALVAQNEPDPLRHARTTHANALERLIIAPYWVNYHCEHHMFTQVPCWNLPKVHRLLAQKGVTPRMEIEPSYLSMLNKAASQQAAPASA